VLGLIQFPVSLIGFDMGGAVATGFAAKYPDMCQSLTLIGSLGCKYKLLDHEPLLKRKYIGEIMMYRRRATIANYMESEVFDGRPDSPHRPLVDKHIAMMQWQIANTPGYLGALLSGFRLFPLRGMEELFTAIGRYNRPVLVIWGDKDVVCPYKKSIAIMERSFPSGYIVDIRDCGHNPITEKFNETMTEILSFHKMIFDAINKLAAQQNHDFNDSFFQNV
jgi:pimeloyl-ACP methyl ester carboxylesterase